MPKDTEEFSLLKLEDLAFFRDEEEREKCKGKYIATESFKNREVLRRGKGDPIANINPADTLEEANRMGCKEPVIFYYPDSSKRHIFSTFAK